MDIEVGSKWIRVAGDDIREFSQTQFLGQEVVVVPTCHARSWGRGRIWIRRKNRDGKYSHPVHLSESEFISHFSPLNISLENK